MVYKKLFKTTIQPDMRKEAYNYIKYHLRDKAEDNPRAKPTPNAKDLRAMLCFLYTSDQTWYPNEYYRVQQGVLMLLHAFSGVRPSSAMNPRSKNAWEMEDKKQQQQQRRTEELARLCYKDIEMFLEKDDNSGAARLGMRVTFTRFKGELNRKQNKEFTYRARRDPMTCLVTQFLVMAVHNGVFAGAQLDIRTILSLEIPADRQKVVLAWRPEWLLRPVFTAPTTDGNVRELSRDQANRWLKSLGNGMGLKESLTWRCWRRLVSNAVDQYGSEEQRNQITGHLDSQTYRAHYQNQRIQLDIPALVMGEEAQDSLDSMCADTDPQANACLTLEEQKEIDSCAASVKAAVLRHLKAQVRLHCSCKLHRPRRYEVSRHKPTAQCIEDEGETAASGSKASLLLHTQGQRLHRPSAEWSASSASKAKSATDCCDARATRTGCAIRP